MSDIFISYAKKDASHAKNLAISLENEGFNVWWDIDIPIGKTFDDIIEKAIDDSKCVIVLWSENSISSEWVHIEAAEGKRRNILIPVRIQDVVIPFAFRRRQTADLINWNKKSSDTQFRRLVKDIHNILPVENTQTVNSTIKKTEKANIEESTISKHKTKIIIVSTILLLSLILWNFITKRKSFKHISNIELKLFDPDISGKIVSINGVINGNKSPESKLKLNWGDGSVEYSKFPITHEYKDIGSYQIIVSAMESETIMASDTLKVIIKDDIAWRKISNSELLSEFKHYIIDYGDTENRLEEAVSKTENLLKDRGTIGLKNSDYSESFKKLAFRNEDGEYSVNKSENDSKSWAQKGNLLTVQKPMQVYLSNTREERSKISISKGDVIQFNELLKADSSNLYFKIYFLRKDTKSDYFNWPLIIEEPFDNQSGNFKDTPYKNTPESKYVKSWERKTFLGKYRIKGDFHEGGNYIFSQLIYEQVVDFYAAVDFKFVKYNDPNSSRATLYFGKIGNTRYLFHVTPSNYFKLLRFNGEEYKTLIGWTIIPKQKINPSEFNRMAIAVNNKEIDIYMNNKKIIDNFPTQNYLGGKIGLQIYSSVEEEIITDFDNFELRSIAK